MGNSYKKISFMCLDKTPVEVLSASTLKDFNSIKSLNDFCNMKGTFMVNDADKANYVFTKTNNDFIEFNTL